jgi:tetratricopeptide (TPR) repeat protein
MAVIVRAHDVTVLRRVYGPDHAASLAASFEQRAPAGRQRRQAALGAVAAASNTKIVSTLTTPKRQDNLRVSNIPYKYAQALPVRFRAGKYDFEKRQQFQNSGSAMTEDELIESLAERVRLYEAGDKSQVLGAEAHGEFATLGQLLTTGQVGNPKAAVLMMAWFPWLQYNAASEMLGRASDRSALREALKSSVRLFLRLARNDIGTLPGVLEALLPTSPRAAPRTRDGVSELVESIVTADDGLLLDQTIELLEEIIDATGTAYSEGGRCYTDLAVAYEKRFDTSGNPSDLDASIFAWERAAEVLPADLPSHVRALSSLSNGYRRRFPLSGDPADGESAVQAGRRAVAAGPSGEFDGAGERNNLAAALLQRGRTSNDLRDVDKAVDLLESAAGDMPSEHYAVPGMLSNLAEALQMRYRLTGDRADLDRAIGILQQITAGGSRPSRHGHDLISLAGAFRGRFHDLGDPADLDSAVAALHEATEISEGKERAEAQAGFGLLMMERHRATGQMADLDDAVAGGSPTRRSPKPSIPRSPAPATR